MFSISVGRAIHNGRGYFYSFFLLLCLTRTSSAQVLFEIDTGNGLFFGGLAVGKTTDIGAFDQYVGPLLAIQARSFLHRGDKGSSDSKGGKNSSYGAYAGSVNQVTEYLGKKDRKLGLKYAGRLGWRFTVGYETSSFYKFENRGLRISLHKSFDLNSLKAFAPQGVGVLIDPTSFTADVRIENTALTLEAPIHNIRSSSYDHTSYLGLGVIRNSTRSHGIAMSDFLSISIIETRVINRPLFSFAYRMRPLLNKDAAAFGLDFDAQLFRTSKMFNLNLNLALVRSFR